MATTAPRRVLSLMPTSSLLGFAYFEGPQLVDWGVTRGHKRPSARRRAHRVVKELIRRSDPDIVLLPSTGAGSRRLRRKDIARAVQDASVFLECVPGREVRRCFESLVRPHRPTKHCLMSVLAEYFPELQPALPRPRKPWESEDYWAPMFDAVAQAFAWKMKHE